MKLLVVVSFLVIPVSRFPNSPLWPLKNQKVAIVVVVDVDVVAEVQVVATGCIVLSPPGGGRVRGRPINNGSRVMIKLRLI